MVVFENNKYACLSCIRGHRSSSCNHRNRILLQVRKPGRKSPAESQSRYALVRKETSPLSEGCEDVSDSPTDDYKLVKVPNNPTVQRVEKSRPRRTQNILDILGLDNAIGRDQSRLESNDSNDDDVVFTEKFVFVHVGDNLYRRELRTDILAAKPPRFVEPKIEGDTELRHSNSPAVHNDPLDTNRQMTFMGEYNSQPQQPQLHVSTIQNGSTHLSASPHVPPQPQAQMHSPQVPHNTTPTYLTSTTNGGAIPPQQQQQQQPLQQLPRHQHSQHIQRFAQPAPNHQHHGNAHHGTHNHHATHEQVSGTMSSAFPGSQPPLIIGPMQLQNERQSRSLNLLDEIGITQEEAQRLWPGEVDMGHDLSYASMCVIPGRCECGDDCECLDCFEHKLKRQVAAQAAQAHHIR